ncbi:Hypothetical predicted protein, partial [Pelobates cultripes]
RPGEVLPILTTETWRSITYSHYQELEKYYLFLLQRPGEASPILTTETWRSITYSHYRDLE